MAKQLQLRVIKAAKNLPTLLGEEAQKLCHPIIIATKGHPCTGRRLLAFLLAATLRCPLIKEDDIGEEPNQASNYRLVCQIASSQLEFGLSVVVDSQLCNKSQFTQLESLSKCTETPLVIVECQALYESKLWQSLEKVEDAAFATRWWDKPSSMEDLRRLLGEFNAHSDYDVANIPKFIATITPAEDIKKCVSYALQSIANLVEADRHQAQTAKCECHEFEFGDEQENKQVKCAECLQKITGPIYKCNKCNFIFHKSCTELPIMMQHPSDPFPLYLKNGAAENHKGEAKCNCCKQILTGYFYGNTSDSSGSVHLDLNCLFLPFNRIVKFHNHPLRLSLEEVDFKCDACGILIDQKLSYTCNRCGFRIDPNCAWLPETAVFERHRHLFKLSLSPRDDSDEYYCDVCETERDPNYWIYYCAECDYPSHTRCLVPAAWPPLESESDNK
ncbi:hypothetical protein CsSME_00008524 [Camellia sinensis var. sinensis]